MKNAAQQLVPDKLQFIKLLSFKVKSLFKIANSKLSEFAYQEQQTIFNKIFTYIFLTKKSDPLVKYVYGFAIVKMHCIGFLLSCCIN